MPKLIESLESRQLFDASVYGLENPSTGNSGVYLDPYGISVTFDASNPFANNGVSWAANVESTTSIGDLPDIGNSMAVTKSIFKSFTGQVDQDENDVDYVKIILLSAADVQLGVFETPFDGTDDTSYFPITAIIDRARDTYGNPLPYETYKAKILVTGFEANEVWGAHEMTINSFTPTVTMSLAPSQPSTIYQASQSPQSTTIRVSRNGDAKTRTQPLKVYIKVNDLADFGPGEVVAAEGGATGFTLTNFGSDAGGRFVTIGAGNVYVDFTITANSLGALTNPVELAKFKFDVTHDNVDVEDLYDVGGGVLTVTILD